MENWESFKQVEKEGLTKKYKNNYYMADTTTRIITIFRNCEGNDVVIFRKPLIESCYLESQKAWENLCKEKETKIYHNREEFLSDDGFTKEEKEEIVKEISEVLEEKER
jgi:hypothetical protein